MGVAAYNRGSKVISERIAQEHRYRPGREESVTHPAAEPQPVAPTSHVWKVGDAAYCKVHGAEGWYTVVAVRPRQIKIDGCRSWCPASNFKHDPAAGEGL